MRRAIAVIALVSACGAPQTGGWQRDTYVGLSTCNGAIGGAFTGLIVAAIPCLLGMSHGPCSDGSQKAMGVGVVAGGISGGVLAYRSSSGSTTEPSRNEWILTTLPADLIVVGLLGKLVATVARSKPEGDEPGRLRRQLELEFSDERSALQAIRSVGQACEVAYGAISTATALAEREVAGVPTERLCRVVREPSGHVRVTVNVTF